jgi:hypothetical protein
MEHWARARNVHSQLKPAGFQAIVDHVRDQLIPEQVKHYLGIMGQLDKHTHTLAFYAPGDTAFIQRQLKQAKVETVVPVVYDAFVESLGFDTYTARLSDVSGMEEFKDVLVKMSRSNVERVLPNNHDRQYRMNNYQHVYIRLRLEPPPAPPAPAAKPAEDSCCVIQ